MIASGAGLYVVYTPFNAMLFDRLVAVSGRVATAGFLIYVADSAGYAGSCGLLLWRNFGMLRAEWLTVFKYAAYTTSVVGLVLVSLSLAYFSGRARASVRTAAPDLRLVGRYVKTESAPRLTQYTMRCYGTVSSMA